MLNFFLKIFLFILIPTVIHSKLRISVSNSDYIDYNDVTDPNDDEDYLYDEAEEPMRVVDASHGLDQLLLRFATLKEISILDEHAGHIMEEYKYKVKGLKKTSLPSSISDEKTTRDIKTELEMTINNFMLSLPLDPDLYNLDMTDKYTEILIYYRNYIEILVIRLGQKQWNYVLGSHSTLPDWFYGDDVTDKREIPDIVKKNFFLSLISKIKILSNNLHL